MQTFMVYFIESRMLRVIQFTPFQKGKKKAFLFYPFNLGNLVIICSYPRSCGILCSLLNHYRNCLLTVFDLWINEIVLQDTNT